MAIQERADLPLRLGRRREGHDTGAEVVLPAAALLRHVMSVGSSGSGKTVFCKVVVEEAARRGIPVLAIDPQGDLCSLALGADGDDPLATELAERLDVVVFTPASRSGVPLTADPVSAEVGRLSGDQRLRALSRTASRIVSLLGYDLDGDDGAGLVAVFDHALNDMADEGRSLDGLRAVIQRLEGDGQLERYARLLDVRKIRAACQRAARLEIGARRLLFHDGVPIDIDVLLGRAGTGAAPAGKTRVAVVYLNTLEAQEDKEFVVATLAERMVAWMLQHPSPDLQALFYLDEVAPFIPPVRKPACKEDLQILFKQARKFGIGCLVATQNPGDIDYKAMGQFGTWALGRLATRQDVKKVEPAMRSLIGDKAEPVLEQLPALRPGEMILLSPDAFEAPCPVATRRLHTPHRTLDEEEIETLATAWRSRFPLAARGAPPAAALDPEPDPDPEPEPEPEPEVRRSSRRRASGARRDLGLRTNVLAAAPVVDEIGATGIGWSLARSRVLGFIGEDESLESASLLYRPLYRVSFEEKVKRPLLGRLIGPSHEERLGSLYLDPCSLDVLVFSKSDGIRFTRKLPELASKVDDLDGSARFVEVPPATLPLDEPLWRVRQKPALARKRVRESFRAHVGAVTPVFVPLWRLVFQRETGAACRAITVDALVGKPVDWPDPSR
jgi:hypothetical protein